MSIMRLDRGEIPEKVSFRGELLYGLGYMMRLWGWMFGFLTVASFASVSNLKYVEVCRPSDSGCRIGNHSVGAGLGWSRFKDQTAFWPKIELEFGVVPHVALELVAGTINLQELYHSASVAPTLILGAGLRYYVWERYHGPVISVSWFKHLYRESFSSQRYQTQSAVLTTLGWRWRPKNFAGSLALGAGIQKESVDAAKIQPALEGQVAVDFNLDDLFF